MTYKHKLLAEIRTEDYSPVHKHLLAYICTALNIKCTFTSKETYKRPCIVAQGKEEELRHLTKVLRRLTRGKPKFKVVRWGLEERKLNPRTKVYQWKTIDSWVENNY